MNLDSFERVWLVDTEFRQPDGERPQPHCLVAKEFHSGRTIRVWLHGNGDGTTPKLPIQFDESTLFVAYYASAELQCFEALGWPYPAQILDLYAEFRCLTSGRDDLTGYGLLAALAAFGLASIDAVEKASMRDLALRGGPYTADEQRALLDYCQSDVEALARLLPKMAPLVEQKCGLLRGRYMTSVAKMEWTGIPVDAPRLSQLKEKGPTIVQRLIERVDRDFGVFDGTTFKAERWEEWLTSFHIPWPRHPSGTLDLRDDTFKEMGRWHPKVEEMRQLRKSLAQLRNQKLPVGSDGRNRTLLSPFVSKTGRNQPSTSRFIFGLPACFRFLIKPQAEMALAYIDYEQQEFGIGAALSEDARMMEAYRSGDPYLSFAVLAGGVPADATKSSRPKERELFKTCALGVQYGMGAESLAQRLNIPLPEAQQLLELHHETFPKYWSWSDAVQDHAMLTGELTAAFGWKVHVGQNANPRSLRNFPLQANGSEMLRIACVWAAKLGIRICAPIHDALLIEAGEADIGDAVKTCQACMEEASKVVLAGFPLRTEVNIIRYPERYTDPRGGRMWREVSDLLGWA